MFDTPSTPPTQDDIDQFQRDAAALIDGLNNIVVGQHSVVRDFAIALLSGGHVLLEGLPGLGKTELAKAAAHLLGAPLARVQGTPDLMPFDILGSEILRTESTGGTRLEFSPGPIFSPLVLLDEVNRAPPKTQSALLEAMQEGQVSAGGQTRKLPAPFMVIATQNMIEFEGTYPLPEAQLDRFLMKIEVAFPDRAALLRIALGDVHSGDPAAVLDLPRLVAMQGLGRAVVIADHVAQAAVDLVLATHPGPKASAEVSEHVAYGASPRALQALLRAGAVHALMQGRAHLAREDLAQVALPILRHRVLLDVTAGLDGISADSILSAVLAQWRQDVAAR
ncbi:MULTISPECIES: AAA family ATPase [unclassified Marinovum]